MLVCVKKMSFLVPPAVVCGSGSANARLLNLGNEWTEEGGKY